VPSHIGSKLPLPTQQITVDRFNSFASANVHHRRLPQQNLHKADMGITAANACYRGKVDIDQPLLIVISIL
jgi:hypothetical protein